MTTYESAREILNGTIKELCDHKDLLIPSGYLWEQHRDSAAYVVEEILTSSDITDTQSKDIYAVAGILLDEWDKQPQKRR